ncbi:beta-propeller domain-containing protein [Sporosarcina sp. ACRSL]|uniref:beta-propeller domain-containing protein n=1 Tax=Sporosarcina sp. ACRSL TaxID=2918215 RepID=UPI001EF718C2|nr:beta-propeller domain-containing protein [Sporosarcina sp. ACRSL]MCG7343566.1 beta-propeller domain-containing protein [Sporosarcina sp. ACRSL]
MKLRKPIIWIGMAMIMVVVITGIAMFMEKVNVIAAGTALSETGWKAHFSEPLTKEAISAGYVYVTNQNGDKVEAKLELTDEGHTLQVEGLQPGDYTLRMDQKAVNSQFKSLKRKQVNFIIYDSIESISSADDLKVYFQRAKDMQSAAVSEVEEESTEKASMDSSASSGGTGGGNHSSTNIQVEGVDESDMVKTDGDYVYSVFAGTTVKIIDIRNPQKMKVAAEIKPEDDYYPLQLFLHDELLIVLGNKMEHYPDDSDTKAKIMPMNGLMTVRMYNIEKPEKPVLLREIGVEGYLKSARKTDGMLYLVTNVFPYFWAMDEIDGDVLRPRIFDSNEEEKKFMEFEDISILPGATDPSYSVIAAIDLTAPKTAKFETKGFLGSSDHMYMTKDHLYLTAMKYKTSTNSRGAEIMIWNPGTANTEIFKFKLDGTAIEFHRSAELNGTILNQFSMDEYKGNFRVAMTEGNRWDDRNPSKNHLYVLDENMDITGSVKDLAKGERIYSARFMGDKAYMVTFRETDPLFVIDVADPTKPKVLGELKIPGFSNYLHPLDEHHLIGFGYETVARKNPYGGEPFIITKGMKLSLFDVSDFHNPKEKFTEIIGGQGTYSALQYDHKALFQHKQRNLFGFPVSIYDEAGKDFEVDFKGTGALVYEITPDRGIVLKGDLVQKKASGEQYEDWEKQIQRLLYSGESVFTLSMKEINSYDLDSFEKISTLKMK